MKISPTSTSVEYVRERQLYLDQLRSRERVTHEKHLEELRKEEQLRIQRLNEGPKGRHVDITV